MSSRSSAAEGCAARLCRVGRRARGVWLHGCEPGASSCGGRLEAPRARREVTPAAQVRRGGRPGGKKGGGGGSPPCGAMGDGRLAEGGAGMVSARDQVRARARAPPTPAPRPAPLQTLRSPALLRLARGGRGAAADVPPPPPPPSPPVSAVPLFLIPQAAHFWHLGAGAGRGGKGLTRGCGGLGGDAAGIP